MTATARLLSNTRYTHLGNSHVPARPALGVVILTCMDARIDVFKLFGLRPGDAQVLRNAGGRVTEDVIRSLAISQALLGTEEVLVLHHTDCALSGRDEDGIRSALQAATGHAAGFDVLAFADDQDAVRQDVDLLRTSPDLPHRDHIRGFLYDIRRGAVDEVQD